MPVEYRHEWPLKTDNQNGVITYMFADQTTYAVPAEVTEEICGTIYYNFVPYEGSFFSGAQEWMPVIQRGGKVLVPGYHHNGPNTTARHDEWTPARQRFMIESYFSFAGSGLMSQMEAIHGQIMFISANLLVPLISMSWAVGDSRKSDDNPSD